MVLVLWCHRIGGEEFDNQFNTHYSVEPNFDYYETHEFHTLKNKLNDPFSILHTNICSLQHNGDNLNNLLAGLDFKFDVVALTETWNPDYKEHTFQPPLIDGYSKYMGTTGSSLKGGCGMYINSDLKPLPRNDLNIKIKDDDCEIETFWSEIILDKQPNRLICVVYRHPVKNNDTKTAELLNTTFAKIRKENKKVTIAGDFNFDLLIHEKNPTVSNFLHMMLDNNFQPCIIAPTRIVSGNKPSLVDNIFINTVEKCISGNLFEKISDHMPNFVIFENAKDKPKRKITLKRDTKNFDAIKFQEDLRNKILTDITNYENINESYDFFHKNYQTILNKHAPVKSLTKKQQELERKPWVTKGILTSTKIKSQLYKKFKKSKLNKDYQKFKIYRNTINSLLRKSKKHFYKEYFTTHANNIKKTWKGINGILNRNSKSKASDIFLNINGNLLTSQKAVADKLNDFFINVADNLAKKIPKPNTIFQDYLKNPNEHSLFLSETTPGEVAKIISNLGANKASDIYGNSNKFLKMGGETATEIIVILFNQSIAQGVFPQPLKNAKVIPCHKGDSILEMSNYRPISLLPIFSKVFEKLMYTRVIAFINKHKILYKNQFGFQSNMCTEYAVNSLINNVTKCLENQETGICIFLDFAKAFDTVNHDILLKKLEYYGIRGIAQNWFKSYLSNRMQGTDIGGIQSSLNYIKCGVPQGSVLGPLLFLLYINDIVNSSKLFQFTLFADDTSLFYSQKNTTNMSQIVNIELEKISHWLGANKLSLNVKKSQLLVFTLSKKIPDINLTINGEALKEVQVAKYLGILIDNKLNWGAQIQAVNLKLSKGIGLLAKIRHYVPKNTLRSLYFTFINPHIDYNILNWGMASLNNLNSISNKIKKAVRIMAFKNSDDPTIPLFKELKILPLESFIDLRFGKFIWKLNNHELPDSLISHFRGNNRTLFSIQNPRLVSSKRFVTYAGPKLWNEDIPNTIKQKKSLKSFAKKYMEALIDDL